MEHAIFISNLKNLRFVDKSRFNRLYFGNEFCEYLIPKIEQIKKILDYCEKEDIELSFVTAAFLKDSDIIEIEKILNILPKNTEVIFNDYGLLEFIKKRNLIPIQGRVLTIITRDPRKVSSKSEKEYMMLNSLTENYQKKMIELGVNRFELDNVKQGYKLKALDNVKTSIYYPYVFYNITRNCVFYDKKNKTHNCEKDPISANLDGYKMYIKGNVQYYINNNKPETKNWNTDRLVYMPTFPNDNSDLN